MRPRLVSLLVFPCLAMADHLRRAADHFQAEAETLASSEKLLWWNSPEGPDPGRNAKAAALLKGARAAYAAGIAEIEKALARSADAPKDQ